MNGLNSYEEMVRNPGKEIIDFEYLVLHPEAKLEIASKYRRDPLFRQKLFEKMCTSPNFKQRFDACFRNYGLNDHLKR